MPPDGWRQRHLAAGLALALALGGCVDTGSGNAPKEVLVAGRLVTIAAPQGFCIDRSASRDGAKGAFVLMGSCASLSQSFTASRPRDPAILTASVYPGGDNFEAGLPGMAAFLASPAGRKALSRSGKAASVTIGAISTEGPVLYIRAADSAPAPGQEVEPEYWRAILTAKGQIVSLSVLGLKAHPLASGDKQALLRRFVARVQAANRQ
ncbi:MAG: hypothetical protein JSS08_08845 [Proteobacteria bacterium]|nr:hypothetical protein [Pseudomonadota bacterium]